MSRKKIDFSEKNLLFGQRLKKFRKYKGLNLVNISEKLKVSQGFLSDVENGKACLSLDALLSLLSIFTDLNPNWLLTGEGEMLRGQGQAALAQQQAQPGGIFDRNPEVMELLEDARYVLTSGNFFAYSALERNIKYFRHAVAVEKELEVIKQDNAAMRQHLMMLAEKVSALEKALKPPDSAPDHGEGDGGEATEKKAM